MNNKNISCLHKYRMSSVYKRNIELWFSREHHLKVLNNEDGYKYAEAHLLIAKEHDENATIITVREENHRRCKGIKFARQIVDRIEILEQETPSEDNNIIIKNLWYVFNIVMKKSSRIRKLDWQKVSEIRVSDKSIKSLAIEYRVHRTTISRVLNNKTWKAIN